MVSRQFLIIKGNKVTPETFITENFMAATKEPPVTDKELQKLLIERESQLLPPTNQSPPPMSNDVITNLTPLRDVIQSILFLEGSYQDGSTDSGTGFLVEHEGNTYLCTAAHILQAHGGFTKLHVYQNRQNNSCLTITPNLEISTHMTNDMTHIKLQHSIKGVKSFASSCFHDSHITQPVRMAGYALDPYCNHPTKGGIVFHETTVGCEIVDREYYGGTYSGRFFLTSDPSINGFSGGPVFIVPKQIGSYAVVDQENYYVLGIVSGCTEDNKGRKFGIVACVSDLF